MTFGNLFGCFRCLREESESLEKLRYLPRSGGVGKRHLLSADALSAAGRPAPQLYPLARPRTVDRLLDLPGHVWGDRPALSSPYAASDQRTETLGSPPLTLPVGVCPKYFRSPAKSLESAFLALENASKCAF